MIKKLFLLFFILCYGKLKSQTLDDRTVNADQFAGFCKVWGLAKFYHSDVTKQKIDWDNVLIEKYSLFIENQSFDSFNENISLLLDTLIKKKNYKEANDNQLNSIFNDKISSLKNFNFLSDTTKYYNLVSFSWINDSIFSTENKLRLSEILINYEPQKSKLLKGKIKVKHKENKFEKLDSITEPFRILSLFRYWNIINYYFPYKNIANNNWDEVLIAIIPEFIETTNYLGFVYKMKKLAANIDDSHGYYKFSTNKYFEKSKPDTIKKGYIPYKFKVIDSNVIVSKVLIDSSNLNLGDTVLKTGRYYFKYQRKNLSKYVSHSTAQREILHFENIISNSYRSYFDYVIIKNQDTISYRDSTFVNGAKKISNFHKTNPVNYLINDSTGYIDLTKIKFRELKKGLKKYNKKETIIFDIRGYPNTIAWLALPHLLSKNKKAVAKYNKPNKKFPGTYTKVEKPQHYRFWFVKPFVLFRKKYEGKFFVLIDANTISQAETVCMMFKAYSDKVTFIGTPTAGANGDVSTINLPGGLSFNFSSLDWHFPNGNQLQRIGIIPDIYVKETIEGVQLEKDEIFEKAVELAQ